MHREGDVSIEEPDCNGCTLTHCKVLCRPSSLYPNGSYFTLSSALVLPALLLPSTWRYYRYNSADVERTLKAVRLEFISILAVALGIRTTSMGKHQLIRKILGSTSAYHNQMLHSVVEISDGFDTPPVPILRVPPACIEQMKRCMLSPIRFSVCNPCSSIIEIKDRLYVPYRLREDDSVVCMRVYPDNTRPPSCEHNHVYCRVGDTRPPCWMMFTFSLPCRAVFRSSDEAVACKAGQANELYDHIVRHYPHDDCMSLR